MVMCHLMAIHGATILVPYHHCHVTTAYSGIRHQQMKLEQLERLRSEDTPRRLMITHTIESCWIPSQNKVE